MEVGLTWIDFYIWGYALTESGYTPSNLANYPLVEAAPQIKIAIVVSRGSLATLSSNDDRSCSFVSLAIHSATIPPGFLQRLVARKLDIDSLGLFSK